MLESPFGFRSCIISPSKQAITEFVLWQKSLIIHKEPNRNSDDKLKWNQTDADLNTRKSVPSGETVFGFGQTTWGNRSFFKHNTLKTSFTLEIL